MAVLAYIDGDGRHWAPEDVTVVRDGPLDLPLAGAAFTREGGYTEATFELDVLENVVTDALSRLPTVLGRIQATRSKLAGLLPPGGAAGASSEPESDDPAQGQLVG